MVGLLVDSVLLGRYFSRVTSSGLRNYCTETFEGEVIRGKREELLRFIDSLRIHVRGGCGGDGLPKLGGIGGRGGDVIVVGSDKRGMTLKNTRSHNQSQRYAAKPGEKSKLFCIFGKNGESIKVPVPLGVSVVTDHGQILGEVNDVGEEVIVAKGGEGGNQHNGFCGQKGQAHNVLLDLKLLADVGFVGFPNAGKSTLLKAISRAAPRIASYPFTTVRPNIGVVTYTDDRQISLADLPGLIEGAHANKGMGHKFLKHVERTKLLLFVVDVHGFQLGPKYPFRTALETICLLNKEIELYQSDLTSKPALLALNKTDVPGAYPCIEKVRDTLFDDDAYQEFILTLPEEFRPKHPIRFDDIVPISAKKGPTSVEILRDVIRKYIDINDGLSKIPERNQWHA